MLLERHPHWMTREGVGRGSIFWVVQEARLPSVFAFWHGDPKERIFKRGEFPWEGMIDDLPTPRYFGEQGTLPQRAASCRVIDEASSVLIADPIMADEIEDHLVSDPTRPGEKAIGVETRGAMRTIGEPKLLVPHLDHVIVRIAWCSSVPMRMNRERLSARQAERVGGARVAPGTWSYTPVFEHPTADIVRYVLAYWDVPI